MARDGRHGGFDNTNRFVRDGDNPKTMHHNKDNEPRKPAETACGLSIAEPVYYSSMSGLITSNASNACSPIGECIYCHYEGRHPDAAE